MGIVHVGDVILSVDGYTEFAITARARIRALPHAGSVTRSGLTWNTEMLAMSSSLLFPPWTEARFHQEAETMASSGEGRSQQCVQGSRREWGSGQLYHRRFAGNSLRRP
uniref:Uncharacterized protein n=1 Tax=Rangifer tarandus platyrhynchus TaxID=3082113 RepID=A0ACB0EP79_RANTA|nr:unnamed protein product [Rangifer tarandus platyrhynchus]